MNLIIDQGNTVCKIAFFEEGEEPVGFHVVPELTTILLKDLLQQYRPISGILSTVKDLPAEILDFLRGHLKQFIVLDAKTPLPIRNGYATPETLGKDRLAAAVGAWTLQPGKPLLIVDMGTAITYDFVRADGTYVGGNIAPGLQTRLRSLHQFTGRLPLVSPKMEFPPLGEDTETAIRSGVMQGIVYEVEGYLRDFRKAYPELFAFLTGGDLNYFDGKLKNSIFVSKNLVITGLDRILRYNVHT